MDEEDKRIKEEMEKFKERLEHKQCGVRKELDTINHKLEKVIKTLDEVESCIKKILDKLKL